MQLAEFGSSEFTPPKKIAEEEDGRLRDLERAIKRLLAVSVPLDGDDVELPNIGAKLSPAEGRAFLCSYDAESSFRADYAAAVRTLFVVHFRLASEMKRYLQRFETTYLWQDHVSTLNHLLGRAAEALQSSHAVAQRAALRGLKDHAMTLEGCRERLGRAAEEATAGIQERMLLLSQPAPAYTDRDDACLLD